jgi:uncharacterized protein (TIRG00374 family)
MVLRTYQWWLLLEKQEIQISFRQVFRYYFTGLFFNNFMPGNVGGDIKKVWDINKHTGQFGAGFTATLFDRLLGLFFLNGLSLGVGVLFFINDPATSFLILPSLWIFFGFVFFFSVLFSRRLSNRTENILRQWAPGFITYRFCSVRDRFHLYRDWNLWIKLIMLSSSNQILRVLVHWFCAIAIGVHLPLSYFLYFIPIIAVVSALPLSIGGFGPRELLAQTLFSKVGVSPLYSVMIQLLAYGVTLIVSLCGGIFFVTERHKRT